MCEELSYQVINTSAVNQVVFCYYQNIAKIIIEKKTLVLTVASKAEIHFFELLIDQNQAALVNGSSRQIRKFSLWNGFGVDMALPELNLFLYKFGLF